VLRRLPVSYRVILCTSDQLRADIVVPVNYVLSLCIVDVL